MQPQRRSPAGRGSEIRAKISPSSGVKITESANAQPKPILRREPTSPTSTERSEPDSRPKITNIVPIATIF